MTEERFDYPIMKSYLLDDMLLYSDLFIYRDVIRHDQDFRDLSNHKLIISSIAFNYHEDEGMYNNDMDRAQCYAFGLILLMGQGGDAFDQKAAHNIRRDISSYYRCFTKKQGFGQ